MSGKYIVIVGASRLGCRYALAACAAGHRVTLIDEHPQGLKNMSFDAPYFYGSRLPASLADEAAAMDNVLSSNELLMECAERDVDLRIATVAWGAFHDAENSRHIGTPKVAVVNAEGNELIEYDQLILATGSRDFVPSFKGWEQPGVLGGKAACKLLEAYQAFDGTRALVLGTTPLALEFTRAACERGIGIVALVEPTDRFQASDADREWLAAQGIEVLYGRVILATKGANGVVGATIGKAEDGSHPVEVACDTICIAIGSLPNIELPAAMGCRIEYFDGLAAWMPEVSDRLETSVERVHWLSACNAIPEEEAISRALSALTGEAVGALEVAAGPDRPADYMRHWVERLHATGGADVVMCQCEGVTREEFTALAPPRYLGAVNAQPQSPVAFGETGPRIEQDLAKRMTRVGMGHCQGKRCRDEAAMLLATRYGIDQGDIRPSSYRFPVRPIDLELFAAEDDNVHTRERWPHWLQPDI